MTRILPENFPATNLSAVEIRRLEYFYEHFVIRNYEHYGTGHFALACYAALPAILTADIVNKLWLNFKNYSLDGTPATIHAVAPADLLLSPLVEETGLELFEMAEPIRRALLLYLKQVNENDQNNHQYFTLNDIAEFLRDYATYDFIPRNADDDAFREAQQWTAMSYLDPGRAFAEVAKAFNKATSNAGKARYKDAMEKMSSRFVLKIVKNEEEIPEGFKAMTALTSVIRDVLQNRSPSKLDELKTEALNNKNLLTDEPLKGDNYINIEVPEEVRKKIIPEHDQQYGSGMLRVLIIGFSPDSASTGEQVNVNSANIFSDLIAQMPARKLIQRILTATNTTKKEILDACFQVFENSTENDDILLYLAVDSVALDGHCMIDTFDPLHQHVSTWLSDEEIGTIIKSTRYASVTLILDTDHAATPYWLDTSDPRHIILASSKYESEPSDFTIRWRIQSNRAFTYAIERAIRYSLIKMSNRDLFINALRTYQGLKSGYGYKKDTRPQLLGNPLAYNRFILEGKNNTVELQNLLLQTGYCDEKATGAWNANTASALDVYCSENNIAKNLSKQAYIQSLKDYKEIYSRDIPLFVFIFSDKSRRLAKRPNERRIIMDIMETVPSREAQWIFLDQPKGETLINTLQSRENRNRIELIYYSGHDDNGNIVLKDGSFDLFKLASLLAYQENLKLIISNTCNSAFFCEYATQIGAAAAIGIEGVISDESATNFGIELFRAIASGTGVEAWLRRAKENRTSNNISQYQFLKAAWMDASQDIQWNFNSSRLAEQRTTYAVIITCDDYPFLRNLDSATIDGQIFQKWLINHQSIPAENIFINNSKGINSNEFSRAFEELRSKKEISKLYVYIKGIGAPYSNPPFFAFSDSSEKNRDNLINIKSLFLTLGQYGINEIIFIYDIISDYRLYGLYSSEPGEIQSASIPKSSVFIGKVSNENPGFDRKPGNFSSILMSGLMGEAADSQGNITANSFTSWVRNHFPSNTTSVFVQTYQNDFIIAKLPKKNQQKANPIWKFRNQWIWVLGTDRELNATELAAAKAIGRFIANEGYGLITGGWSGVDHVTAKAYYNTIESQHTGMGNQYLIHVLMGNHKRPDYNKGKVVIVSELDWSMYMHRKSIAAISIGGDNITWHEFHYAYRNNFPFIPIPQTGGTSLKAYNLLMEADPSNIKPSKTLLQLLGQHKSVEGDSMLNTLKSILDELDRNEQATEFHP